MKIITLKALRLLLRAGYSVSDAIAILNEQFQLKIDSTLITNYDPLCHFARSSFPVWCAYPYAKSYRPLDAVGYIDRCLAIIDYRRQHLKKMVELLWYPIFLLGMAIFMGALVLYSLQSLVDESNGIKFLLNFFMVFLISILVYLCWLIRACIQLTFIDWLVVVDLHLSSGWLLGQVIRDLEPCGRLLDLWKRFINDIVELQSFANALVIYLTLDLTLVATLRTYETMGNLNMGVQVILPDLIDQKNKRFIFHVHALRILLYLFIVGVIFSVLMILYRPILNRDFT
ncbi:MAG: hypothetical protein ACON35_01660 [Candidatus Marinamargulisbacteria bacterium]